VSRPRRLIVVCHQFPPWRMGGMGEYAERFLRGLRIGHGDLAVRLYTFRHPGGLPRRSAPDGVTVVRPWLPRGLVPAGHGPSARGRARFALALLAFNLGAFLGICGAIRAGRRGTVVAVHDWQSTPAGILAAALLRVPVVYHVHNTEQTMTPDPDVADPYGIIRRCQSAMAALAARIVAPTPELAALLVRHGWPGHRIRVVPHGYEDPTPSSTGSAAAPAPAERARLLAGAGFPADSAVLVFAGRLSPVKGVHTLLRAMPEIARRHPRARLFLLGVGLPGTDQDAAVDRMVAELGIGDRTHAYHRHLPREEVRRHYLAADVCLFPSTYEPFGLVSVEAMAIGVPVVLGHGFSTTISGGDRGAAALRLTADDPAELAAAVDALLSDPEYAARLGERGRRHVERRFTWAAAVDATMAVYTEAVTPAARARPAPVPPADHRAGTDGAVVDGRVR
jgi:glycogen synthase